MRLRVQTDWWAASLLAAVGLVPVACGGKSEGGDDGNGSGATSAAGTYSGSGGSTSSGAGGTRTVGAGGNYWSGGTVSTGTGGSTTGTGGGWSSGGDAGAGSYNRFPCRSPMPLVDPTTGYQVCDDGAIIRPFVAECPSTLPRPEPVPNYDPAYYQCQYDSDCTEMAHGYCGSNYGGGLAPGAYCNYGCVNDAECGAGSICECGEPVGHCVPATCTSDHDCEPGFHCADYDQSLGCQFMNFACQKPADACLSSADCAGAMCSIQMGDTRTCVMGGCAIGRPFLIDEVARIAGVVERSDWSADGLSPALTSVDAVMRQRLSQEWTRAGQFEHASIAAFARFMLELLAFAAPAELVADTARAIDDERRHAKLCFALASAYAGRATGPAALDIDGALGPSDLGRSLLTTIREGCIGETVAALEAAELAQRVTDPVVRQVLEGIAGDEKRHAELAFRFVKWTLGERPELASVVASELSRVSEELEAYQPLTSSPAAAELSRAGVAPVVLKAAVRASALQSVVVPGLCALIEDVRRLSSAA